MVQNNWPLQPKIWELVLVDLKKTEFLEVFNSAIKMWEPKEHQFYPFVSLFVSSNFFVVVLQDC